jgi:hypothetical protein
MNVDTFEDFLFAIFEAAERVAHDWYGEQGFAVDDEALTGWYIRLFSSPEFLAEKYRRECLEWGFGAMLNCTSSWLCPSSYGASRSASSTGSN